MTIGDDKTVDEESIQQEFDPVARTLFLLKNNIEPHAERARLDYRTASQKHSLVAAIALIALVVTAVTFYATYLAFITQVLGDQAITKMASVVAPGITTLFAAKERALNRDKMRSFEWVQICDQKLMEAQMAAIEKDPRGVHAAMASLLFDARNLQQSKLLLSIEGVQEKCK